MKNKKTPRLIPAIIQDYSTKEVLMLGYMSRESLTRSIEDKRTWFYSRSKARLWNKGESSGNFQDIEEIRYDCDRDALLVLVRQKGDACHTGHKSCFYRTLRSKSEEDLELDFKEYSDARILEEVYGVIDSRIKQSVDDSYTYSLHKKGLDEILKKTGEEVIEVIIGAKHQDKRRLVSEISDLLYHLLVLLVEKGISLQEIYDELRSRRQK